MNGHMKRILYVQFTNPAAYPSLGHSARILANQGWEVRFIATGAEGANNLRFEPHERISVRRLRFSRPGPRQKLTYVRFAIEVAWAFVTWRPRVVYCSDALSTPAVLITALRGHSTLVYHEHDASPEPTTSRTESLVRRARRTIIRRAAMCIAPNNQRLDLIRREMATGTQTFAVMNCPSLKEIRDSQGEQGGALKLIYAGSLVPSRIPLTVIEGLARSGVDASLTLAGYETIGHPGHVSDLLESARDFGIPERVRFVGLLNRRELLDLIAKCDVGLAIAIQREEDVNLSTLVGASNKPFDYLSQGVTLLVADDRDWRSTFVDPGFALACDPGDPASILDSIRWFANHRSETREMGEAGRQRLLEDWNYETQFAPVLELLES